MTAPARPAPPGQDQPRWLTRGVAGIGTASLLALAGLALAAREPASSRTQGA